MIMLVPQQTFSAPSTAQVVSAPPCPVLRTCTVSRTPSTSPAFRTLTWPFPVQAQGLQCPCNASICRHGCKHRVGCCTCIEQRNKLSVGHHVTSLCGTPSSVPYKVLQSDTHIPSRYTHTQPVHTYRDFPSWAEQPPADVRQPRNRPLSKGSSHRCTCAAHVY